MGNRRCLDLLGKKCELCLHFWCDIFLIEIVLLVMLAYGVLIVMHSPFGMHIHKDSPFSRSPSVSKSWVSKTLFKGLEPKHFIWILFNIWPCAPGLFDVPKVKVNVLFLAGFSANSLKVVNCFVFHSTSRTFYYIFPRMLRLPA